MFTAVLNDLEMRVHHFLDFQAHTPYSTLFSLLITKSSIDEARNDRRTFHQGLLITKSFPVFILQYFP